MHPFKRIIVIGILGVVACGPHVIGFGSLLGEQSSPTLTVSERAHKQAQLEAKLRHAALIVKEKLREAHDDADDSEEIDD
jgi:hypothetical protein